MELNSKKEYKLYNHHLFPSIKLAAINSTEKAQKAYRTKYL